MLLPLTNLPPATGGGATRPPVPLLAGQTLRAVVAGESGALFLRVAGQRVPLALDAGFTAGQTLQAEVVAHENGLALRVGPPPVSAAPPPLSDALRAVLATLGQLPAVEDAAVLVPAGLANHEAGLRQVLLLLFEQNSLGADMQLLARLAARGGAAGVAQEAAGAFSALAAQDAASLKQLIELLVHGRSSEARIAAALAEGNLDETIAALKAGLREQVARLRGNDALRAWLRGQGAIKQFEAAAGRVLERLDANALQNLRGLEHPYVFLELPAPPDSGCLRARVHFFGEGRGQTFKRGAATVALDLSMSRLGDVWVTLETRAGHCVCRFRARQTETVEAVREHAGELAEALGRAGFSGARVEARVWDGDRLRAAADLARACAGLDVST